MDSDNQGRFRRLPKLRINRKKIAKRVRRVENATAKHAHKFLVKRWSNVREVQRHVIIWTIIIGALIAATGMQLMWYQKSYKTYASAVDVAYAEGVLGPVNTMNPLYANTSAEQSISSLLFSRILKYDKTGNLNNDIATNISIAENNTKYIIDIRPDVRWSDGQKLTTADIAFTIGLMQNPSVRSVVTGWDDIVVNVINDTRIEFKLKSSYASFEHALTFAILPKHILKNVTPSSMRENSYSQNPVGSGPFMFKYIQDIDSKTGKKIVYLTRNDKYFGGNAKISTFQLHIYDTTEQIVTALSTNEINSAADLIPSDLSNINKQRYEIISKPIQTGLYAILNMKSDLMNDKNVRKALQVGTDTNSLRKNLGVTTNPLDLPFTRGQISGNLPTVPAYNKAQAMQYFSAAGWNLNKNGNLEKSSKELKIKMITMKNGESENALDDVVKQWKELGVTVETSVIDLSDLAQNAAQNILQPRNFDVLIYQMNIGADPDVYAYWHSSQTYLQGLNYSNYASVIVDDALSSARSRIEPDLRNAKYITFAKRWVEDVPAIGLYQISSIYVQNVDVSSFSNDSKFVSATDRYANVLDWSVGSRSVYKTP